MIANSSKLILILRAVARTSIRKQKVLLVLALLAFAPRAQAAWSLVMTNGYGDTYRMNLLRDRDNYQAYRGFSLSGCSTTGEVVMLRIKATPSMPEHYSLVSTSLRWGTTMYFLNDVFRPLCSWVMAGYENWYPFDMSCSAAMYINSGDRLAGPVFRALARNRRHGPKPVPGGESAGLRPGGVCGIYLPGIRKVYQGALGDLNSTAVLRSASLPAGDYTFYFGLDEHNGKVDEGLWFDAAPLSAR
ncbi:MAG: hypothetical protein WC381_00250 [Kiritimatiellia bacterium]